MHRADDDIPNVIPEIEFTKDGEPVIAKQFVVEKSPIPRAVLIVTMVVAFVTLLSSLYFEKNRNDESDRQHQKDFEITQELQRQQDYADEDRLRLQRLIIQVLSSKSPAESRRALEQFLAEQRAATGRSTTGVGPSGSSRPQASGGGQSDAPTTGGSSGGTGGGGNSQPSPSPKPSPSPSRSPLLPGGDAICCVTGVCFDRTILTYSYRFGWLSVVQT
jgi:hypothetical protein